MRWSVLVTLLAGCFAPTAPTGAPCDTDDHCPSDQRCVAGACQKGTAPVDGSLGNDGMTIDGPPDDVDADGVLNANDNCPNASNGDQHDEDADAVGDACDNCPHVANSTQANTMEPAGQADAVGDACDPRPATGGDTIQRFIPFHVVPQGVSTPLGSWTIQNDTYRNDSNFKDAEFLVADARDRVTVEIAGTLEAVQGDTTWLAVSAGQQGNPARFYDCGYLDFPPSGGSPSDYHTGAIEYYDGANFDLRAANHQLNNRLNGAFTIRIGVDSTIDQVRCTTIDARQTANTMEGQATPLQPGTIGVKALGATFSVRYLIVFGQ